jgi:hypothetical protein
MTNLKTKILTLAVMLVGLSAFSQAVRDRNVIPVAVNLNQVLRMTISDGGNIEFTFNTINDYRLGLSGDAVADGSANAAASDPMYITQFTVASSTEWDLFYGSENATFIGTDNSANTLGLDNVGFSLASNGGTNTFGITAAEQLTSLITTQATVVADLDAYPVLLMGYNTTGPGPSNAGDAAENSFTMTWRCGTGEAGDMNTATLLEQTNIVPDRYVTNVLFELAVN